MSRVDYDEVDYELQENQKRLHDLDEIFHGKDEKLKAKLIKREERRLGSSIKKGGNKQFDSLESEGNEDGENSPKRTMKSEDNPFKHPPSSAKKVNFI